MWLRNKHEDEDEGEDEDEDEDEDQDEGEDEDEDEDQDEEDIRFYPMCASWYHHITLTMCCPRMLKFKF